MWLWHVQTFTPLVEKCKRLGRAMRIGTNHGSLSARILSYYGDTPRGMVRLAAPLEPSDYPQNMFLQTPGHMWHDESLYS